MAIEPINYNIDTGNPVQTALQGYLQGSQVMALQQQRQQEQAALQAKAAQQAQMQADFQAVANNPNATGADFSRLITLYPQLSEGIKRAADTLSETQKQTKLDQTGQIYSALQSGKPDIARGLLQDIIDGAKNSGDNRQAAMAQGLLSQVDSNPQNALAATKMMLVTLLGPDKFAQAFGQVGTETRAQKLFPSEFKQKEAEATIKAEEAKAAPEKFANDLKKQGWDIQKLQEDIRASKEGTRLRAMEVALSKERNDISRQELQQKIDDAREKQAEKLREKVANAETELDSVTDAKGLLGEILGNKDSLFAATGLGAFRGAIPGTEARTMAGKLEQLQNMLAATNLDKLKGPMSDKDIMFVKRIAANLDRYQDEDLFEKELTKVNDILTRTEEKVRTKYSMPKSSTSNAAPSIGPKPGAVEDGYRFKGGDPSKAENWEKT